MERSKIDYEKILNKKNIFVGTEFFKEVLQKILVNRVVIISGEPGVGKTTLAEQAALFYLGKYHSEIFFSVKSVDDIYRTLLVDGKKVIFYDDFWGGNGLIDFDIRNTSRELVRVIERINKTRDCILIMTTREYILEQGLKQNEELRKLIEKHKLECQITQYSEADRLKIYYGHLKLADLTWNQMLALKECDDYVVYSKNYNPRVLELFFKNYVKNDIKPKKCVDSLKKYLECPMDFWEDTFRGLSKEAGILYIMMAVMPMPVELEILEECYNNYIKRNIDVYEWKNFQDTVIELEKTVIRTDLYAVNWSGMIAVTFQNPSVKDFLIEFLKKNLIQYQGILEGSCKYYAQYVEYLRILDKVNAPIDIYIKIFKGAIEAVGTDTIVFYDKYKRLLEYNDELDKYYQHYKSKQDYRDIGFGRWFQLFLLYKPECGDKIKHIVKNTFLQILRNISQYPECILKEDLNVLPRVILVMWQTGICRQILSELEICMDSYMRNRESIYEMEFQRQIPEIWDEYVRIHREKISGYLEKYYNMELCTAAASEDEEEFIYQMSLCEECYEEYQLNMPENLQKKIRLYDSWFGADIEEKDREEEKVEYEERKQSVEEIKEEFQKEFLDGIYDKFVDDLDEWIKNHNIPENIKTELELIRNSYHILWSEFIWGEDSLDFLEKIIAYEGILTQNLKEAVEKVNKYMFEKSGLDQDEFLKLVSFVNGMDAENQNAIWTETQLKEKCADLLFEHENLLADMVEAGILVNHKRWYRLTNRCLLVCAKFKGWTSNAEKISYYKDVQKEIKDENYVDGGELIWELLYQEDPESFKEYILVPVARNIYEEIFAHNENWMEDFIEFLKYEYDLTEKEADGGMSEVHERFQVIDVYLQLNLFWEIASIFDETNINKLRQKGIIDSRRNVRTVSLEKMNEHGLLEEFEINKKLEWAKQMIYKCQRGE